MDGECEDKEFVENVIKKDGSMKIRTELDNISAMFE